MKKLFALAVAFAVLAGCGDTLKGTEYAEATVARFREQMKARQFEQIYDSTGADFKTATSREIGVALFAAVDRKLGSLKRARQINWTVNTHNLVTTAVLVYDSEYSGGNAMETFTVKVDDGQGELVGYNIQSLQMLIR
jgi:hypothetical protein